MCKANHSICYVEPHGYVAQYMRNIKPHNQVMDMKLSTGNRVLYQM